MNVTNAQQNGQKREAARLLAVSADGASVWKTTTPSTAQSTLSDTHYQIAAKLALGVPPVSLPSDCNSCHKANACAADPFHPLSCNSQKGREITLRHDAVVNDLQHGIRAAGGACTKEPTRLSADGDKSRPDLQAVIGAEQVLVDVTIGNPTCQTYQDQCPEEQLKCDSSVDIQHAPAPSKGRSTDMLGYFECSIDAHTISCALLSVLLPELATDLTVVLIDDAHCLD